LGVLSVKVFRQKRGLSNVISDKWWRKGIISIAGWR